MGPKVDLEIYTYSPAGSESLVLAQKIVQQFLDLLILAGENITSAAIVKHNTRTSSLQLSLDVENLRSLQSNLSQLMNSLTQHQTQNG